MHNALGSYFQDGLARARGRVGIEVETIFVDEIGRPLDFASSTAVFGNALKRGWRILDSFPHDGMRVITALQHADGTVLGREIGTCNLEISGSAQTPAAAYTHIRGMLDQLYRFAEGYHRHPDPVWKGGGNLLPPVASERERMFLALDGESVTNMLAGTSSVQFTIDVPKEKAIMSLNNLAAVLPDFLKQYPQDTLWKTYVLMSRAGYRLDRYGGPLGFDSIRNYCERLAEHRIIDRGVLREHSHVGSTNLTQFVKSVWWYFRLRRYGDQLCIEVRPLGRYDDAMILRQLAFVLDTINL